MELLDSDLHRIIQSPQALGDAHHRYFMFQLLKGVKVPYCRCRSEAAGCREEGEALGRLPARWFFFERPRLVLCACPRPARPRRLHLGWHSRVRLTLWPAQKLGTSTVLTRHVPSFVCYGLVWFCLTLYICFKRTARSHYFVIFSCVRSTRGALDSQHVRVPTLSSCTATASSTATSSPVTFS